MMNKTVFLKTMYLIVVMGFFLSIHEAFAAGGSSAFQQAYETLQTTFENARSVVYVLSGFGLIGIAVGAIFGKINFKWLAMICIALAMLAGADQIVGYSVNKGVESDKAYLGVGYSDFDLNLQFRE